MAKQTLVVNLFGGPGAGKTTCAMEICVALKKQGLSAEYVPEYAKELVYANRMELLDGSTPHQKHIFQEQKRKIDNMLGKVDVIVTDSPVILSSIYDKEHSVDFEHEVLNSFNKNKNFNLFITRGETFETTGRIHNLEESVVLDSTIKNFLEKHNIFYCSYTHESLDRMIKNIHTSLQKSNRRIHQEQEETKQIIEKIKQQVKLTDYAEMLGFTLVKKGKYYSTKEHDSLMIDPEKQKFWHNSLGISGDIIDFVQHFENIDKHTALEKLTALAGISNAHSAHVIPQLKNQQNQTVPQKIEQELVLPERDNHTKNVYAYLTQTRKLDHDIVTDLILSNHLYQDTHKNCVFVSYNTDNDPVFANQRGTNTKNKFIADIAGSNYDECFYLNNQSNRLIITESVIDALSVATIIKKEQVNYQNYNYLALSGTNKIQSIFHHLKNEPNIDTVVLALDNDKAGHIAFEKINKELNEMGWNGTVVNYTPKIEKDWNEELQNHTLLAAPCKTPEEMNRIYDSVIDDLEV